MTPKEHFSSAHPLMQARRVVIKVGSALLVDAGTGNVRREWLDTLAADVAALPALLIVVAGLVPVVAAIRLSRG